MTEKQHTALYRKYRSDSFKNILGQDHVVSVLEGALKQGNIGHAYLFVGSRGIGKTSIARILASEIGTTDKDLYEIDAASNRGIDAVRELREAVNTLPFDSQYKVYIIDEMHMLTKEAFNALLKTLEEPPAHVVFMLATTEPHKLPDTIISRCEVHTLKKPNRATIKKLIMTVAKHEGVTIDAAAADLVALLADGSFRDALGILQKTLSVAHDKQLSLDVVAMVLGAPSGELVNRIVGSLAERTPVAGINALQEAHEANIDMTLLSKMLLEKLRAVLLFRYAPSMQTMIMDEFSEEDVVVLQQHATTEQSTINARVLERFLTAHTQIPRSAIPRMPLELALIESCITTQ